MKLVEKLAIELGMGPKGCKEREGWNKAHPLEFEALDREEWFAAVGFVEGFRKALELAQARFEMRQLLPGMMNEFTVMTGIADQEVEGMSQPIHPKDPPAD